MTAEVVHGTRNAYNYWRCRCEECKAAQSEWTAEYREQRKRRPIAPRPVSERPARASEPRQPSMRDWKADAACARGDVDPEWFHTDQPHYVERAKAVCVDCPVRVPCLEFALRHRMSGIWSGTTAAERGRLARESM